MSSGTINNSNKIGSKADGVAMRRDVVNTGSEQPNELTGQSGAVNTSETTSGLTAGSQVPVAIPPISRESDPYSKDVSTAFSTDSFKSQASPRGETNDQLEGVGG
jgi:hypothetical protein